MKQALWNWQNFNKFKQEIYYGSYFKQTWPLILSHLTSPFGNYHDLF